MGFPFGLGDSGWDCEGYCVGCGVGDCCGVGCSCEGDCAGWVFDFVGGCFEVVECDVVVVDEWLVVLGDYLGVSGWCFGWLCDDYSVFVGVFVCGWLVVVVS